MSVHVGGSRRRRVERGKEEGKERYLKEQAHYSEAYAQAVVESEPIHNIQCHDGLANRHPPLSPRPLGNGLALGRCSTCLCCQRGQWGCVCAGGTASPLQLVG